MVGHVKNLRSEPSRRLNHFDAENQHPYCLSGLKPKKIYPHSLHGCSASGNNYNYGKNVILFLVEAADKYRYSCMKNTMK